MSGNLSLLIFLVFIFHTSFAQQHEKMISMKAVEDFPLLERDGKASNRRDYAPFHIEKDLNALAGDDLNYTFHMAAAEGIFPGETGTYTVCLNTLTERDGECVYNVYVNDEPVGLFQKNPPTNEFTAPATLKWESVEIPAHAKIRVESNNWSNLLRHELNFFEYARGRWTSVDFISSEGSISSSAPNPMTGIFSKIESIGSNENTAKAKYNEVEDAYYIMSSDTGNRNISYLLKEVKGDFTLETLVTQISPTDAQHGEAGLMICQSLATDAPYMACVVKQNGQVSLQYVAESGADQILFTVKDAEMIQVEKKGHIFTMSAAIFGEEYERHSVELKEFTGTKLVGLYIRADETAGNGIARFSRMRFYENLMGKLVD